MDDLRRALSDVAAIRGQLARAGEFRGYGPAALAATSALALAAALAQPWAAPDPGHAPRFYAAWWAGVALLAGGLIAAEAVTRSRRLHVGLEDEMVRTALAQFLPAAAAGLAVTVAIVGWSPAHAAILPGVWQVIFCLGVFATCRILPRPVLWVGVWYLITGLICLAAADQNLAPWMMGAPFCVGQALAAALLWCVSGREVAREAE